MVKRRQAGLATNSNTKPVIDLRGLDEPNDSRSDGTAVPSPTIVTGPGALGVPVPLPPTPPLDAWTDGVQKQTFTGKAQGVKQEFPDHTRVIYVNGINSNDNRTTLQAQTYANAIGGPVEVIHVATHGIGSDLHDAFVETTDPRVAFRNRAELDVARESSPSRRPAKSFTSWRTAAAPSSSNAASNSPRPSYERAASAPITLHIKSSPTSSSRPQTCPDSSGRAL